MAKKISLNLFTIYSWEGSTSTGAVTKGTIRAENIQKANSLVSAKGINIIKLKPKSKLFLSREESRNIKQTDINLFLRQLATMLNAGVPLSQALEFVAQGVETLKMASLITQLYNHVSSGGTLASGLEKFPKYFTPLIIALVKVGETSGTMDSVLNRLATYLERMASLKAKIKKAMYYPVIVLVVMLSLATILLTFIVPRFQGMFKSFGKELPGPTQFIINLSNFLQEFWWLLVIILIGLALLHFLLKKNYPEYNFFLDSLKLKLPIFGIIIKKAIIARSVRTISVTLAAGVNISDALDNTIMVAGNQVYTKGLKRIRDEIVGGEKMKDAMQQSDLFPSMVIQMIGVGEQAGTLEMMLTKVSEYYDEQVNNAVESLSSLMEPIMILLLGVIVGGFVVSMYLPIFKIGTLV